MPDLYHPDPVASRDATLLDMLDARPSEHTPRKTPELEDYQAKVGPEVTKRRAALDAATEYEQEMSACVREVGERLAVSKTRTAQALVDTCTEIIGMGSAADARALGALWRASDDETVILSHTVDLLHHVRIPAARIARLEAALELARVKELAASIAAALAHSKMLDKLIVAGVFDGGRVGIVSEEVETLRAVAKECARQVSLAEDELREQRKRQQTARQQRLATGGVVTRAEISATIPTCAG